MLSYALKSLLGINIFDRILRKLFGDKSRWFQLHTLFNIYITCNILPDVLNIYTDSKNGYMVIKNNYISYDILCLHIYHIICFDDIRVYDYFHHILFVGLGVIPIILYTKSNQVYLMYIACCGIPGTIEYMSLSLKRHGCISIYTQKTINYYLYLLLRFPLCILGVIFNITAYYNKLITDLFFITLYLNLGVLMNAIIFTFLTIKTYHKLQKNKLFKKII